MSKPKRNDISIGKDKWITFVELDGQQTNAIELDEKKREQLLREIGALYNRDRAALPLVAGVPLFGTMIGVLDRRSGEEPVVGVIRSTVLIAPDGTVAHHWATVKAAGHAEQVRSKLAELQGGAPAVPAKAAKAPKAVKAAKPAKAAKTAAAKKVAAKSPAKAGAKKTKA